MLHFTRILTTLAFSIFPMTIRWILSLLVCLLGFTACEPATPEVITDAPHMTIHSSAYKNNGTIPIYFTCYGSKARIPFEVKDIPERTKSLAVFLDDPDSAVTWHHWLMWNIPPEKKVFTSQEQFTFPEGTNSSQIIGYLPPCPPVGSGTHRYIMNVYALDDVISADTGSTYSDVQPLLRNHTLDRVTLTGTYEKTF